MKNAHIMTYHGNIMGYRWNVCVCEWICIFIRFCLFTYFEYTYLICVCVSLLDALEEALQNLAFLNGLLPNGTVEIFRKIGI